MTAAAPARSAWAALPDGITALGFAAVWCSPFVFGPLSVKTAMLTMLVEFFLIHGTGFFTAISHMDDTKKAKRILGMLGLSLFYLLMIGAFAWTFEAWWPLLAFLWLLVGKIFWVVTRKPDAGDDQVMGLMAAWAGSVVAYLFGCMVTVVPSSWPRWGMTEDLQPGFGLAEGGNGGLWIDEPHRVVAFGVVYFGLLCGGKLLAAHVSRARRT